MRLLAIGGGFTLLVVIACIVWWPDKAKTGEFTSGVSATQTPEVSSSIPKTREFPSLRPVERPSLVAQDAIDAGELPVNVSHTTQAKDSLAAGFDSEERNAEMATRREDKIRVVVKKLQEDLKNSTSLSAIECKSRHCKLQLGGEIDQMMPILDALQDERGMMGQAESMMFTRENEGIQVYLRFPEPRGTDPTLLSPED